MIITEDMRPDSISVRDVDLFDEWLSFLCCPVFVIDFENTSRNTRSRIK